MVVTAFISITLLSVQRFFLFLLTYVCGKLNEKNRSGSQRNRHTRTVGLTRKFFHFDYIRVSLSLSLSISYGTNLFKFIYSNPLQSLSIDSSQLVSSNKNAINPSWTTFVMIWFVQRQQRIDCQTIRTEKEKTENRNSLQSCDVCVSRLSTCAATFVWWLNATTSNRNK